MANTYTLAQLETRCRERADMENSKFISSSELLSYINASYAELYDILVGKFEDYYTISSSETIAQGANTIPLPSDFYKFRGLDFQVDSQTWVAVGKFNFAQRNVLNNSLNRAYSGGRSVEYRIVGSDVIIEPESNAPGSYKLWYTPVYTPLAAQTDTIDGLNGFEEYVIIDAAIKMLAKEESSTTHLQAEKAAMLKRIETMSQNRDSGQPESITDTSLMGSPWDRRLF